MKLDEIGPWSEVKLEIIKKYSEEYSRILRKFPYLDYSYIDAFAGAGIHKRKKSTEFVLGSPFNALNIEPKFKRYYFIDIKKNKTDFLKKQIGQNPNVIIENGDCNKILPDKIFPKVRYDDYKRALCFLDPYGLHLHWDIVKMAGNMKSIEVFINFPLYDMQLNVLKHNIELVQASQQKRMNDFWGGDEWIKAVYSQEKDLFDDSVFIKKGIAELLKQYKKRLKNIANFDYVPDPIAFYNENGGIIYYIFFATQNETANKIVSHIFNKYRKTGSV